MGRSSRTVIDRLHALLHGSPPQNFLRRAKEFGRLDTESGAGRACLYAGLIVVARAQIALDRDFLAHLVIGIERLASGERAGSNGGSGHRQLAPALLTRAARKETAKTLPACRSGSLLFQRHNGNVVVGTAFGADAAADAAFSDVDLTGWHASNPGAATEHADRVLAVAAGSGDADIAYHHALAIHTRMAVTARAGFLALVTVNTLIQVNDQHLCPFDDAAADQRAQTRTRLGAGSLLELLNGGEKAGLRRRRRLHILLEPHLVALGNLWIASEQGEQCLARHLGHNDAGNGAHRDRAAIAQQVEAAREVVAALSIGDDALAAFRAPRAAGRAARYFDKPFQQDMQRLPRRSAAHILAEKLLIAIIAPDLRLFCYMQEIEVGDTLKERQPFENGLDRARIIQFLKEGAHGRNNFHQALHDLFRHFQRHRSRLRARAGSALLAGQHAMLAHIFPTPKNGYRQRLPIGADREKLATPLQNQVEAAAELAFMEKHRAGHQTEQLRGRHEVQQVVVGDKLRVAEHGLFAQATEQGSDVPASREIGKDAVQIHVAIPGNAEPLLKREHEQVAVVIDGADGNAGTAHHTFFGETRHVRHDLLGDGRAVQIGNVDPRRERHGTGAHTTIAADAHINLKAHLLLGQRNQVWTMLNAHYQGLF